MMNKPVILVVRSIVSNEYNDEFDEWYHKKHIPTVIEHSGCKSARRFKGIELEDKFDHLAVYEFNDMEAFLNYWNNPIRKELVLDFQQTFGDKVAKFKRELRKSIWEQIFP